MCGRAHYAISVFDLARNPVYSAKEKISTHTTGVTLMTRTNPQARETAFRVVNQCFGLSSEEILLVTNVTPAKNRLVVVEFNNVQQLAIYVGPHVQLADGTVTWLYNLIGTVV